jgi:hypothetical protein
MLIHFCNQAYSQKVAELGFEPKATLQTWALPPT